jgi:two-component system NtrC family response regulator
MSRILIVDDDKIMNDALSRAILRTGHEVESRQSIKEGLKEVNSNYYDVVYLDVRMPDGDGLESLTKFREAPSSPDIIIITGYAKLPSLKLYREVGLNSLEQEYLEKLMGLYQWEYKKGLQDFCAFTFPSLWSDEEI